MVNISSKLRKEYSCYSAYKDNVNVYNSLYKNPFDFISETERNEDINFICKSCKIRQFYLKNILSGMHPDNRMPISNNFAGYFELTKFYDPVESNSYINILCKDFLCNCLKCIK